MENIGCHQDKSIVKKQISAAQKMTLIEFVEANPELVKQKHSNQYTNAEARRLWQEIAIKLNSIPGSSKTWEDWRKTWRDLKNRTKKKKALSKRGMKKTGGGPATAEVINEIDEKILDIMGGNIVIEGLVNIPEVGLPIEKQTENDNRNLGDHSHYITEGNNNDGLVSTDNNTNEREDPKGSNAPILEENQKINLKVTPPRTVIKKTPYSVRRSAANQAASDLVRVTEEKNIIKENYYNKKLQIMQESLEIERKNLQVQQSIAASLELLLKKGV